MDPNRRERFRAVSHRRQLDVAVVLENVHDPHNIGAVLRSCDSVGIQNVYVLFSDPKLSKTNVRMGKRSSAGARKWVDVHLFRDTESCINVLREKYGQILVTAVSDMSRSLYTVDMTKPMALVFGNEHTGVSDELLGHADGTLHIPQMGMVRSLNISVTCAVTLYEMLRQRVEAGQYEQNITATEAELAALDQNFVERHNEGYVGRLMRDGMEILKHQGK